MLAAKELENLLSRVAIGDRDAFKTLYVRTSAKLFGICIRILNDRNEAEAVLQDVYLKVWNNAGQFQAGRAAVITWLAAIARNQSIDVVRRRKPAAKELSEVDNIADGSPSPEDMAMATGDNRILMKCLEELDAKHANMVKLTYLNGWTYLQAATSAGIPLNTAKTWVRRSLLALRDCMKR